MFRRGERREPGSDEDPRMEPDDDGADADDLDNADAEDEPEDVTADLEAQAADYMAGNDVWMYGPNAPAILEILDRLEEVVPADARPIAEAWLEIPRSDRDHARKAVRKIYESDLEANRHLQLVREGVSTWMAVSAGYPEYVKSEPDWARICSQTGEAALDAATAVILEEKLEEADFEALYTPWSEVIAQLDAEAEAAKVRGDLGAEEEGEDEEREEDGDEEDDEFGPNSDAVGDFLNRLWLLTPEQVGRLVGGWQSTPREELRAAHAALAELVAEDPEYRDQVRAAQEKLAPWLNAARIQETAGFLGQAGQGESRKMAGPALADAIAALVLGDLLEPADGELLYGPWFNLIGAPPLPEQADEEADEPKAKPKPKGATKAGPAPATGATAKKPGAGPAGKSPAPAKKSSPKTTHKSGRR